MKGAGTIARERFLAAMKAIEVGAKLAHRSTIWTVVASQWRETSIDLTLRSGRRTIDVSVSVCYYGPILWEAGLRPVTNAPTQRELLGEAA